MPAKTEAKISGAPHVVVRKPLHKRFKRFVKAKGMFLQAAAEDALEQYLDREEQRLKEAA